MGRRQSLSLLGLKRLSRLSTRFVIVSLARRFESKGERGQSPKGVKLRGRTPVKISSEEKKGGKGRTLFAQTHQKKKEEGEAMRPEEHRKRTGRRLQGVLKKEESRGSGASLSHARERGHFMA